MKFRGILELIFLLIILILIMMGCSNKKDISSSAELAIQKNNQQKKSIKNLPDNTSLATPLGLTTELSKTIVKNIKIPILLYHSVTDNTFGIKNLHVAPVEFDKQMKYLKANNYTAINFADIKNASNFNKPILITIDDGYENNYLEAYPILKKNNFKATIFLCSGKINKSKKLKTYQIKKMLDLIDFQSHTITHCDLTTVNDLTLEKELVESKEMIESITCKEVNVLAYPSGQYNNKVLEYAEKHYKYSVIARKNGFYYTGENNYEIKRLAIERNTSFNSFISMLR